MEYPEGQFVEVEQPAEARTGSHSTCDLEYRRARDKTIGDAVVRYTKFTADRVNNTNYTGQWVGGSFCRTDEVRRRQSAWF
jgi:hypothetical protein